MPTARYEPLANYSALGYRISPTSMNPNQIMIYDTTLRDGTQAEGISFSVHDKIRIAEKLDAFGIHYIEGGWPGSNPKDIAFFDAAKKLKWRNAKICAFGSTCRAKVKPVGGRADRPSSLRRNAGRDHRREKLAVARRADPGRLH